MEDTCVHLMAGVKLLTSGYWEPSLNCLLEENQQNVFVQECGFQGSSTVRILKFSDALH